MATAVGDDVQLVKWAVPAALVNDGGRDAMTIPTVIFAPNDGRELHVGYAAIEQYLFTGLDGRFMQSIKAFLPSKSFSGTVVRGQHRSIEELIAIFLRRCVAHARTTLGPAMDGPVILGRPARFALDEDSDRLAEQRLLAAAQMAGLEDVRLMTEPLAAALAYEARLDRDQVVMVVDLGGGTSDFTVIAVGPGHRARSERERVLAAGGVPVAGDAMDGEIVRAKLLDPLGFGSTYRAFGAPTTVPHWMFKKLLRWNHVSFLKSRKYLEFLREVRRTSDRPEAIDRLLEIVDGDLSYVMFRAVEQAKRAVQGGGTASISDEQYGLPLSVTLTRTEFDEATSDLVAHIRGTAEELLRQAGVTAAGVDAVFMTGGTSLVQPVRETFSDLFSEAKLQGRETFTSVVDGLARAASRSS